MIRPIALAAAVAVSLLAVSGAGGAPAQTPKRGGTLVFRMVPGEPVCLNVLDARCGWVLPEIVGKVLLKPFEIGPDFTFEESLVSRVDFTRRRPFTLTYHIRPAARWSDGVPVTAQDFIFTLRAIRRHGTPDLRGSTPPSAVRVPLIARPCEWFCGRGLHNGTTSSGASCRRTRCAVRISHRSGATGSTIRGRVDPSGAARSSSSGSSAAGSSSFGATPATGDAHPTSSGS